jgi:hypothetical protein
MNIRYLLVFYCAATNLWDHPIHPELYSQLQSMKIVHEEIQIYPLLDMFMSKMTGKWNAEYALRKYRGYTLNFRETFVPFVTQRRMR